MRVTKSWLFVLIAWFSWPAFASPVLLGLPHDIVLAETSRAEVEAKGGRCKNKTTSCDFYFFDGDVVVVIGADGLANEMVVGRAQNRSTLPAHWKALGLTLQVPPNRPNAKAKDGSSASEVVEILERQGIENIETHAPLFSGRTHLKFALGNYRYDFKVYKRAGKKYFSAGLDKVTILLAAPAKN